MSLSDAIATQALWIQIWVGWLAIFTYVTIGALLVQRATWRYAAVAIVATAVNFLFMRWLYGQVGYVRLLGLPHVIVWTPLALYFGSALMRQAITGWVRPVVIVFVISISASLAFDYVDVARWLLGERASMLPG